MQMLGASRSFVKRAIPSEGRAVSVPIMSTAKGPLRATAGNVSHQSAVAMARKGLIFPDAPDERSPDIRCP